MVSSDKYSDILQNQMMEEEGNITFIDFLMDIMQTLYGYEMFQNQGDYYDINEIIEEINYPPDFVERFKARALEFMKDEKYLQKKTRDKKAFYRLSGKGLARVEEHQSDELLRDMMARASMETEGE